MEIFSWLVLSYLELAVIDPLPYTFYSEPLLVVHQWLL